MEIKFRKVANGEQEYEVLADGEHVGNVWKVRYGGWASGRDNHSGYRTGHWGWQADTAPEADYPTRAEAVADMAAVRVRQQVA